jgi:hypothetical protein
MASFVTATLGAPASALGLIESISDPVVRVTTMAGFRLLRSAYPAPRGRDAGNALLLDSRTARRRGQRLVALCAQVRLLGRHRRCVPCDRWRTNTGVLRTVGGCRWVSPTRAHPAAARGGADGEFRHPGRGVRRRAIVANWVGIDGVWQLEVTKLNMRREPQSDLYDVPLLHFTSPETHPGQVRAS